jgi:hypothetical protein
MSRINSSTNLGLCMTYACKELRHKRGANAHCNPLFRSSLRMMHAQAWSCSIIYF